MLWQRFSNPRADDWSIPIVALNQIDEWTVVSVLHETGLSAHRKRTSDLVPGEAQVLKQHIESLRDEDAIDDALQAGGWEMPSGFTPSGGVLMFAYRDRSLSRLQHERLKQKGKTQSGQVRKWLREHGVVAAVKYAYAEWRERRQYWTGAPEPCVTATYLVEAAPWELFKDAPEGTEEAYGKMDRKQKISAVHGSLESARKKGKLSSSQGLSFGRGARCYEPA